MDYEKKYKEAVNTARILLENTTDLVCRKKIAAIFPELEKTPNTADKADRVPTKCFGCNNVKGCIVCNDGDQWSHFE